MNRHLQPITARANAGIKKDCGCGGPAKKALVGNQNNLPDHLKAKILAAPESPAKLDPGTIMKVAQVAGSLGGGKKEKSGGSANVGSASEGYSTSAAAAPVKQAKPSYTDRLYEKSQKLTSKAEKAASEGKNKKAARLENRAARVDKREAKKRAKYNY